MSNELYTVYWARSAEMKDVATDGYVGITVDFEMRRRYHRNAINKNKKRSAFYSWARKHGEDSVVWEILHEAVTKDQALEIEAFLRPEPGIGWNSQRGGELGVEPEWYDAEENADFHSARTSEATKLGIAINDTSEARSARAKKVWDCPIYRERQSAAQSGDRNNCAGLFGDKHPASKLTDQDRKAICERAATGEMYAEIAADFPVTKSQIRHLAKTWGPKNGIAFTPRRAPSQRQSRQQQIGAQ